MKGLHAVIAIVVCVAATMPGLVSRGDKPVPREITIRVPGADATVPVAINDRGDVLVSATWYGNGKDGRRVGPDGWATTQVYKAYVYRRGKLVCLGDFQAAGMNNSSVVVGSDRLMGVPYIYARGVLRRLPLPRGIREAFPEAISNNGIVCGDADLHLKFSSCRTCSQSDGSTAIKWSASGSPVLLPSTVDFEVTDVVDVNDNGDVAAEGTGNDANRHGRAAVWRAGHWNLVAPLPGDMHTKPLNFRGDLLYCISYANSDQYFEGGHICTYNVRTHSMTLVPDLPADFNPTKFLSSERAVGWEAGPHWRGAPVLLNHGRVTLLNNSDDGDAVAANTSGVVLAEVNGSPNTGMYTKIWNADRLPK